MSDEVCLYATVFNNANTLEEAIKSVWRPNYTIIITDNYSFDGTWEKLQELRKEYNLLLYRLKSSRGKGRDYSLRHCPDNSKTAYFDLDMRYNENFHKIIEWASNDKRVLTHSTFVARKDVILNKGGWRDLNYGEDFELFVRVGFDYSIPVINSVNLYVSQKREIRYVKSKIKYYFRSFKNTVNVIRAYGYNFNETRLTFDYPFHLKLGVYLAFFVAKLKGIYRYDKDFPNNLKLFLMSFEKIIDNSELGISDDYFGFGIPLSTIKGKNEIFSFIEKKLNQKIRFYKKYLCQPGEIIVYVKNRKGLENWKNGITSYFSTCKEVTK